jgi:hypothetical protein
MANNITTGTLFIADGVQLPNSVLIESNSYINGWRVITNLNSYGMNQKIIKEGWNFFFLAGRLKAFAFGSDEEKTTRKAVRQVIAEMQSTAFNCLEITQVKAKRFLGFPYMSVSAYSRHIQESPIFSEDSY